jgi:hypothetical protein
MANVLALVEAEGVRLASIVFNMGYSYGRADNAETHAVIGTRARHAGCLEAHIGCIQSKGVTCAPRGWCGEIDNTEAKSRLGAARLELAKSMARSSSLDRRLMDAVLEKGYAAAWTHLTPDEVGQFAWEGCDAYSRRLIQAGTTMQPVVCEEIRREHARKYAEAMKQFEEKRLREGGNAP